MNEREKAINALINNARDVSENRKKEVLKWPNIVKAVGNGGGYIPGYIPYIGKDYFSQKLEGARILIYALSQNLKSDMGIAKDWATSWHEQDKDNKALNRQNYSYVKEGRIMMYPFDTGHLPVVAAMLLDQLGKKPSSLGSIYDVVAATNLSKYSFRNASGRTMDNNEALNKCLGWFTRKELDELKPNYIICAGNRVFNQFNNCDWIDSDIKIIKVAFPSLLVINRRRKKDDACRKHKPDNILSMLPKNDHKKLVAYNGKNLRYVIERDTGYFSNMYLEIGK